MHFNNYNAGHNDSFCVGKTICRVVALSLLSDEKQSISSACTVVDNLNCAVVQHTSECNNCKFHGMA